MFRNMNSEGFCSKQSGPPAVRGGLEVASLKHENTQSSWLSMFSVLSRPALSFLQKYLPGRLRAAAFSGDVSGWINEDIPRTIDRESSFLEPFNFLPPNEHPHVAYFHYQQETAGICAASAQSISWLRAESLQELGIHGAADVDLNIQRDTSTSGYFATAKNFFSQFFMNAVWAQKETRTTENSSAWPEECGGHQPHGNWCEQFGGPGNNFQELFLNVSRGAVSTHHCGKNGSPHVKCRMVTTVAKPTELFVLREGRESKHTENAGLSCYNRQVDNSSTHVASRDGLPNLEKPLLNSHPFCANAGTVAACQSEVAVLTPDQDNGYSSLEEEHSNSRLHVMNPLCPSQGCTEGSRTPAEQSCCTEGRLSEEAADELPEGETEGVEGSSVAESEDDELPVQEEAEAQAQPFPPPPKCQNKAIAYIMGGPCSEESEIESDGDWDSDDDDGFDSEGTSEFSDSDVSDDEDDGEDDRGSDTDEADVESERLWNSLCQSRDPYNPRNFTAALRTAPVCILEANTCLMHEGVESPASPSPLSSPCSSPKLLVMEDESVEEASDLDEAESLRLWNSFTCVADPYNPLNFQAPLRTQLSARGSRSSAPALLASHKKESEERMDSGFSEEGCVPTCYSTKLKKVRFVEEVEEFYASCDEDRQGPWEQFARDRCRFLRRVQETEDVIGYCLAPTYRLLIFQRLHQSC